MGDGVGWPSKELDEIPWQVEAWEELPSTSDFAKRARSWTVVVARRQTAGRGRWGRAWHSPDGGLWLSVAIPPPAPSHIAVAEEIASVLGETFGLPIRAKPPNDLELYGKKLGGILVEVIYHGERAEKVVIGVGINVNNSASVLPPPLDQRAISLIDVLGAVQDIVRVRELVLGAIAALTHCPSRGIRD